MEGTTGETRTDGVPVVAMRHAAAARVQERFRSVLAWYGEATESYWAFVRVNGWGHLVEAPTPQTLRDSTVRDSPVVVVPRGLWRRVVAFVRVGETR